MCSPVVFESHNLPPSICLARREPRRVLCAAALGDVHAALGARRRQVHPEGYPGTRRLSAPPSSRSAAPPPRPLISFLRARCVNVNAPASLCLLCSKRKAPRAATGAQARPAREIRRRCACLPRARLFLVVGSRAADFSGGGARLAHKKQARRATRTAGAASCVAALVGLGRAAFRRSFSSLIAHRGPVFAWF